jgi:hypothetical protein
MPVGTVALSIFQLMEQAMGDFTALTLDTGVGDIHLNRFRIAFQRPAGIPQATLASDLIDHFPTYLNSQFATVKFGDRKHEGKPTLHFHGYAKVLGIDLGAPHSDWVVQEWVDRNVGFTAQTLKREFSDVREDLEAGVGAGLLVNFIPVVGPILGPVGSLLAGGGGAVHYNRMHFLAGRRSWRISEGRILGLSDGVIVLETVAVERLSAQAYSVGNSVMSLESRVPDIWIAFLNNFVNKKGLTVVPQTLQPRWKNKARVDYLQLSFRKLSQMLADPEYYDVYRLYPTILYLAEPAHG